MQFQVPQFIETEDKLIGPLTLRQFIYVAIAGMISVMLYFSVQTWLWFILSIIVVGASIALAFVKINGQPLAKIASAAAIFYWKPHTYVWQPANPTLPKTEANIKETAPGFSLEKIVAGISLKKAWRYVQTSSAKDKEKDEVKSATPATQNERYLLFRAPVSGERKVARRVDFR